MRISGSLETDFDEHAGLFPRPTGPDDRPAPPAGSMSFRVESNTVTGASPARMGWPAGGLYAVL